MEPIGHIYTAIGLMSGTSMDGIDIALLYTDGVDHVEFGPTLSVDYPAAFRRSLETGLQDALDIKERNDRPGALLTLEKDITHRHAGAVNQFLNKFLLSTEKIDFIGFHGHTILHRPEDGLTVQLGDGAALAEATDIDVVFDMRAADMENGGQGAPLVPVFHQALARREKLNKPVCFVNIGGISNVTYIGRHDDLLAFDTGPGNALIDQWVQSQGGIPFDQGGSIASEGRVVTPIVDEYLSSEFFDRRAPKSLDRLDFKPLAQGAAELSDGARSLARVSAEAIMLAQDHLPDVARHWIICGGGRLNKTMMSDLTEIASRLDASVSSAEAIGLDGDMMEAQAFAYLAVRSKLGLPLTFPGTTGCQKPTTGGRFVKASKTVA